MNAKQERFVAEYLIDLNATQAAIRAGYAEKTAYSQGQRLLKHVEVAKAVAAAQVKRAERVEVTQDWILSRLVQNVERAMQAEAVLDSDGVAVGYTYQGNVANKALELLGKHVGMFSDVNIRTPDGPIEVVVTRQVLPAVANRIAKHMNGARTNGNGNGKSKH